MVGPGGVPRTERIGDLIQEAAPLKALGQHCKACRANLFNRDFGCGGIINYPIPFEAEEWLVAQLPDDLDSAAGRMLMYAIEDFDYSGQVVDELRVAGDVLESSVPAVRKWSNPPTEEATTVTSSQVIHMMFLVGNPQQANHAKMVAWYLGILEYKGDRTWDYVIDASACTTPENNQAIAQFKDFLKAAAFAGLNDVDLFVDA